MLDFAVKMARRPEEIEETDVQGAPCAGRDFPTRISGTSAPSRRSFAMSNRLAHLTTMRPNDEFFALGR